MSERDILIERLEKKLAEKEKEIKALRQVVGMNYESMKEEILAEVNQRLKDIEAKITELSKAVSTLMEDVLYLKSEIAPKTTKMPTSEKIREERTKEEKSDDIIICD